MNASGFRVASDSLSIHACRSACDFGLLAMPRAVGTRPLLASVPDWPVAPSLCVGAACRRLAESENCQRTSVVLLLLQAKSIKLSRVYPICFQLSAARPQGTARILCNSYAGDFAVAISRCIFAAGMRLQCRLRIDLTCGSIVGIGEKYCAARRFCDAEFAIGRACGVEHAFRRALPRFPMTFVTAPR